MAAALMVDGRLQVMADVQLRALVADGRASVAIRRRAATAVVRTVVARLMEEAALTAAATVVADMGGKLR